MSRLSTSSHTCINAMLCVRLFPAANLKEMKVTFYLLPRASGKTTMAIAEYIKDKENSLFVCLSSHLTKSIFTKDEYSPKTIISATNFENSIVGKRPKNIILDEYLLFKNKDKIYKLIKEVLNPKNVFIYSTSNKIYSKLYFEFVKNNKHLSFDEVVRLFEKEHDVTDIDFKKELYELYYSFITDDIELKKEFSYQVDLSGSLKIFE